MKFIFAFLIFLIAHSVTGQNDSFRFLNKNRKLNRNYEAELQRGQGSVLFYSKPGKKPAFSDKELLNVYPVEINGDPRFINPDMIELKYDYRKFDMGNLIPNILRPVNVNP